MTTPIGPSPSGHTSRGTRAILSELLPRCTSRRTSSPRCSRVCAINASVLRMGTSSIAMIRSPIRRPTASAGEPGDTLITDTRSNSTGTGTPNRKVSEKRRNASTRFMVAPATNTASRTRLDLLAKLRTRVGSSSPTIRTNPPKGIAFSVISTSPQWPKLNTRGGYPKPNSSILMSACRAARKWPSSWMKTKMLSTTTKATTVTGRILPEHSHGWASDV